MLPQKNSIRLGVVLVGVGVLASLLLVILSLADKKAGGLYVGVNSALSQNAADGTRLDVTSGVKVEAKADGKSGDGEPKVRGDRYPQYLDELCLRLTAAEEDRLVALHPGDPRVLIGLVFAGSARWMEWLQEALRIAPNDPLVHYAILARSDLLKPDPVFDRLKSALELARLSPQDSAPLHAAALESFKRGDRPATIAYLNAAQERSQFSSLHAAALESAIEAYRLAGRLEGDARGRVLLQNNGQWEAATATQLGELLGVLGPDWHTLWGSNEVTALVINANQQAIDAPGFELAAYISARSSEINYLRAVAASPTAELGQYSREAISTMLTAAQAEYQQFSDISWFSQDKAGIYKLLNTQQKAELVERITRDGEVSAIQWAYQTRPDIFRSTDLVPLGMSRTMWSQYIKQKAAQIQR